MQPRGPRATVAPPLGPLPTGARPALFCAAVASAVALAVYLWTLAPSVTLVDSGELIVAAHAFGVAHPPGTPLYVLLAHLATLVPLGSVAVRVNAASAAFAALATGTLVLALREALLGLARPSPAPPGGPAWVAQAPFVVALCLAFSRSLWSYATVAEVYTLNTLLLAFLVFMMLRWRRTGGEHLLWAAAFLFGLALGVHHVSVVLALPALAVLAWPALGPTRGNSRRLAVLAGLALAGLVLVYALLPLAAARRPVLAWGNPVTLERILWHVTGRQYQSFFELSGTALERETEAFLRTLLRQFGPSWLPLVLLLSGFGLARLWGRSRSVLLALALLLLANLGFGLVYVIGEDKDAYYLPCFVSLALAAGLGAQGLLARVSPARRGHAATALLLLPALGLAASRPYTDRSGYLIAEDYVWNVLAAVAPGGMLLTGDWQLYSPLLYFREVEGRRRDVVSLDLQLLRRSWYFDYLRRQYPGPMAATRGEAAAFLEDLTAWERDPGRYARSRELTQRINDRYLGLIRALVTTHPAPVYATRDVVLAPFSPDPDVPRLLAQERALVPRGLVFELARERGFASVAAIPLRTRGLFDGSIRFEPDDVVSLKVRPVYLGMITNRGLYLAAWGRQRDAVAAFEQALALDAGFEPAREALARSRAALAGGP